MRETLNSVERARYVVEQGIHMVIATADESGKPWVSPVFYCFDDQYNLYWVSSKNADHSAYIRGRPEVAIVIFGPVPPDNRFDGVYFDARARELESPEEIAEAITVLASRPQPDKFTTRSIDQVTGDAEWRIYRAEPIAIYKRADAEANGQAITVREPIDIADLIP